MKPIVAVVGRPNVGKSTLVNRLAQTSDAIVHESRGVTRDRSYHTADWNGREFTIVDTGGIEPLKSDDVFATSIRDQALAAAEEAAVILFVVDGRTGVTEEDAILSLSPHVFHLHPSRTHIRRLSFLTGRDHPSGCTPVPDDGADRTPFSPSGAPS